MLEVIEAAFYYFLIGFIKMTPLILTNLSPVPMAKALPKLNYPVDFGKKLPDGKRLFGSHKTWRGVFTMLIVGLITGYLILGSLRLGLLVGLGVIVGDLVTSVIKRRVNLKPGASFEPWDSEILVASGIIFTWGLFTWYEIIGILLLAPLLYKAFNYLGYKLKLQKHPW
jgi:CDP-2,3-bis-(O-geranylgeranyl)-sn-glycerol synthase